MGFIKYIKRLQFIDHLIKKKATGDLVTFAKKNNLSKSALSEILNEMKEMGFPIKYDRTRKSYYYYDDGQMIRCLFLKYGDVLGRDETKVVMSPDQLCFSPTAIFELCSEKK